MSHLSASLSSRLFHPWIPLGWSQWKWKNQHTLELAVAMGNTEDTSVAQRPNLASARLSLTSERSNFNTFLIHLPLFVKETPVHC